MTKWYAYKYLNICNGKCTSTWVKNFTNLL